MLDRHVPCASCAYDLFGLEEDARCPECGASAAESLHEIRNTGLRLEADEIVPLLGALRHLQVCVLIGLVWSVAFVFVPLMFRISLREVLLLGWMLILLQTSRNLRSFSPRADLATRLSIGLLIVTGVVSCLSIVSVLLLTILSEIWQLLILFACVIGAVDLRKKTGHCQCGTTWQFPAAAFLLALICYGFGFFWKRGNIHPTAALALFVTILATLRIIWQARRVLTKCLPAGYTSEAS